MFLDIWSGYVATRGMSHQKSFKPTIYETDDVLNYLDFSKKINTNYLLIWNILVHV